MKDCLLQILLTGLFLGLMPHTLDAQANLTGRVSEETHQPVPFANVLLFSSSDSSLIKGGVAGDDGGFTLSTIAEGSYFLKVMMVGYLDHDSDIFVLEGAGRDRDF